MKYYAIHSTEKDKTKRKLLIVSLGEHPFPRERGIQDIMLTNLGKLVIEEVKQDDLERLAKEYGFG